MWEVTPATHTLFPTVIVRKDLEPSASERRATKGPYNCHIRPNKGDGKKQTPSDCCFNARNPGETQKRFFKRFPLSPNDVLGWMASESRGMGSGGAAHSFFWLASREASHRCTMAFCRCGTEERDRGNCRGGRFSSTTGVTVDGRRVERTGWMQK